jgi:hypothetical protein
MARDHDVTLEEYGELSFAVKANGRVERVGLAFALQVGSRDAAETGCLR